MSAEDFEFKVSLPGYDVRLATPEQCAVHSSYSTFKAKLEQTQPHIALLNVDFTASVTQGITHTLYAIDHGYTYVPFVLPNINFFDDGGFQMAGIGEVGIGATLLIRAYATSSQFIVTIADDFFWTGSNARLEVSYHIFAENGA